jgi:hypothetical protein
MPPKVKLTRDEVSGRFHSLLRRRGAPRDVILGPPRPPNDTLDPQGTIRIAKTRRSTLELGSA